MSEPPTTIRAALARVIARMDSGDLLIIAVAVCANLALVAFAIWGAK